MTTLFAGVSLREGNGGISYVARLVHQALANMGKRITILLDAKPERRVTAIERLGFSTSLLRATVAKPDLAVFDHVRLAEVFHMFPAIIRCPSAIFFHDEEAWNASLSRRRLSTMKAARLRITLSNFTRSRVLAAHPDIGQIHICKPGLLPIGQGGEADRALIGSIGARSVVIVSRMDVGDRHKGHDALLKAWALVSQRLPDAELLVVGTGNDKERLQQLSHALGLSPSVRFLGFLNDADMQAVLRRAAAFVLPSSREGFGLVYLEAMRAGLPCIAGSIDAASETVVHGETGLLVDPHSPEAIAYAIEELLANVDLATRLGAAGQARFLESYQFDAFERRLSAILRTGQ